MSDGEEAVRLLERIESETAPCPNMMILDSNLPKRSDEEILRRLRQSARCPSIPVIVLTSSDSPKDKERVSMLGYSHYFRKPLELNEFMKLGPVVREVLGATPAADPVRPDS